MIAGTWFVREVRSFVMRRVGACIVVGELCGGLLVVCTAGCAGAEVESPAVEVDWALQPDPPHVGPATLTLALDDSAGRPITGADVTVEGNMAHAGMPPVFAEVSEADSGRYIASLDFSMAGDWYLLVDVVVPEGPTIEWTIEVHGVQPR